MLADDPTQQILEIKVTDIINCGQMDIESILAIFDRYGKEVLIKSDHSDLRVLNIITIIMSAIIFCIKLHNRTADVTLLKVKF